jgi:hypothetical protein
VAAFGSQLQDFSRTIEITGEQKAQEKQNPTLVNQISQSTRKV